MYIYIYIYIYIYMYHICYFHTQIKHISHLTKRKLLYFSPKYIYNDNLTKFEFSFSWIIYISFLESCFEYNKGFDDLSFLWHRTESGDIVKCWVCSVSDNEAVALKACLTSESSSNESIVNRCCFYNVYIYIYIYIIKSKLNLIFVIGPI